MFAKEKTSPDDSVPQTEIENQPFSGPEVQQNHYEGLRLTESNWPEILKDILDRVTEEMDKEGTLGENLKKIYRFIFQQEQKEEIDKIRRAFQNIEKRRQLLADQRLTLAREVAQLEGQIKSKEREFKKTKRRSRVARDLRSALSLLKKQRRQKSEQLMSGSLSARQRKLDQWESLLSQRLVQVVPADVQEKFKSIYQDEKVLLQWQNYHQQTEGQRLYNGLEEAQSFMVKSAGNYCRLNPDCVQLHTDPLTGETHRRATFYLKGPGDYDIHAGHRLGADKLSYEKYLMHLRTYHRRHRDYHVGYPLAAGQAVTLPTPEQLKTVAPDMSEDFPHVDPDDLSALTYRQILPGSPEYAQLKADKIQTLLSLDSNLARVMARQGIIAISRWVKINRNDVQKNIKKFYGRQSQQKINLLLKTRKLEREDWLHKVEVLEDIINHRVINLPQVFYNLLSSIKDIIAARDPLTEACSKFGKVNDDMFNTFEDMQQSDEDSLISGGHSSETAAPDSAALGVLLTPIISVPADTVFAGIGDMELVKVKALTEKAQDRDTHLKSLRDNIPVVNQAVQVVTRHMRQSFEISENEFGSDNARDMYLRFIRSLFVVDKKGRKTNPFNSLFPVDETPEQNNEGDEQISSRPRMASASKVEAKVDGLVYAETTHGYRLPESTLYIINQLKDFMAENGFYLYLTDTDTGMHQSASHYTGGNVDFYLVKAYQGQVEYQDEQKKNQTVDGLFLRSLTNEETGQAISLMKQFDNLWGTWSVHEPTQMVGKYTTAGSHFHKETGGDAKEFELNEIAQLPVFKKEIGDVKNCTPYVYAAFLRRHPKIVRAIIQADRRRKEQEKVLRRAALKKERDQHRSYLEEARKKSRQRRLKTAKKTKKK